MYGCINKKNYIKFLFFGREMMWGIGVLGGGEIIENIIGVKYCVRCL